MIPHLRMVGFGLLSMNVFQIGAEDRIYCCLPLFHSAGGGLGAGAMLVAESSPLPRGF